MTQRYQALFARLRAQNAGAFVPFVVLGDPDRDTSLAIIDALVAAGADALELGIPFSDPVADGPVIQLADGRALLAGGGPRQAWSLIADVRSRHGDLPIGLLVYANLVSAPGLATFYGKARTAGVDSVLVADVPTVEAAPFAAAARHAGIAPVLIATPQMPAAHMAELARYCDGYSYVVTRTGVTGADAQARTEHRALLAALRQAGAPPALLGFGIARPDDVRSALRCGAAGVISGSAVVAHIARHLADRTAMLAALQAFVQMMKAATFPSLGGPAAAR